MLRGRINRLANTVKSLNITRCRMCQDGQAHRLLLQVGENQRPYDDHPEYSAYNEEGRCRQCGCLASEDHTIILMFQAFGNNQSETGGE